MMTTSEENYELDYNAKASITVRFSLSDENLKPDEITEILGFKPSRAWSKGDPIPKEAGSRFTPRPTYPFGKWILDAPCSRGDNFETQIDHLLNILEMSSDKVSELTDSYNGEISVAYSSGENSIGLYMDSHLIKRIFTLKVGLNITIYPIFDEE